MSFCWGAPVLSRRPLRGLGGLAWLSGMDEDKLRGRLLSVGRWFLVALAPVTPVPAWW